ncbi:thioredoxin domain-containing protein [Haloparvum sp. PAK95]|uniref:thioredoxin domain-containing protein n=1 Tax=Haloparvum sp. PAK95 TaxID=3418962 RepID=UPI003D2EFDB8
MTTPTDRNRLADEASPYLRQHDDNPVNWQPWDDEAFEKAKEHDVPVFVSIGYSACHWCHVMEEESFADEAVAELINEEFVPIKVDREERPDVDSVYMTVCQLVSGGGGWPLSAWCTPDGDPFYVGTYFPPEPKGNRPGFKQLCEQIADSWKDPEQRAEMENRADQWVAAAKDQLESVPDQPGEAPGSEIVDEAAAAGIRAFDKDHGGFGSSGPKFPQPGRIELLLRTYAQTGQDAALDAALGTLDGMARGGVYDQVGGGFHRYATDRSWTVPHFEKMLYDNAELPRVYLDAYRLTGDPRYAHVAQDTLTFLTRELQHAEGGFFSTLDARSLPPESRGASGDDPEEGAFYTWTPSEVDAVLDDPDASLVKDRYGVTKRGNFEGGTTVLEVSETTDSLAEEYDLSLEEVNERLMAARAKLYDAREERPRPARDEKVLASWNGRTISAFAAAGQVLGAEFTDVGEDALAFVRDHLWDGEQLARRWLDGDLQGPGYLEDYAFVARGAFDLYQTTGDVDHLGFALDLADGIVAEFYDEDAGTIYFTAADGEELIARPQELTDQSTPSSLGIAVDLLLDLDGFHPDRDYREVAEAALDTHADRIQGRPLEHVSLSMAADKAARGSTELTLAADELPEDWWETLSRTYLPGAVLARRPPTAAGLDAWLETLGFDSAPPVWAERDALDGEPTVYACRNFSCSPPRTDLAEALDWFGGE